MSNLSGYTSNQLISLSINTIIPKRISKVHDYYFYHFYNKPIPKKAFEMKTTFLLSKEGFFTPIILLIRPLPCVTSLGLSFISVITENEDLNLESLMIYDPDDYSLIGVNKKCFKVLGLNSSLTTEENIELG